jgi:hypothetical protein
MATSEISALLTQQRTFCSIGTLPLEAAALAGFFHPSWPENRYDRGRLTPFGVETCCQIFDLGKSPMAIAHLLDLSLASARRRRRLRALRGDRSTLPIRHAGLVPASTVPCGRWLRVLLRGGCRN